MREVSEAKSRLELFLSQASFLYIELGLDSSISIISAAFAELLGKRPSTLKGIKLRSLIDPRDIGDFDRALASTVKKTRDPRTTVTQMRLRRDNNRVTHLILYDFRRLKGNPKATISAMAIDNQIGWQVVALLEDDRLFPRLKEDLPICIIRKDLGSVFLDANEEFCRQEHLGSRHNVKGLTDFKLYERSLAEKFRADDKLVMETGESINAVEIHPLRVRAGPWGLNDIVHILKRPIKDSTGKIVGVEVSFWRVSDRFNVLAALHRARETFYRELLDLIPIHIYRKGLDKKFTYGNSHYCKHLLMDQPSLIGKSDQDIFEEKLWTGYEADDDLVLRYRKTIEKTEQHFDRSRNDVYRVRVIKSPLIDWTTDQVYGLQGVFWQVPGEERTLLKEIHHRVFDNFQALADLLLLSRFTVPPGRAREALRDCLSRIKTMAIVHKTLYLSRSVSVVDANEHISNIVGELIKLYQQSAQITSILKISSERLPIQHAMACGLIVAEVVTNSLKHAFHGREKGTLLVSFAACRVANVPGFRLSIVDDGAGCVIARKRKKGRLGLRLIELLTEQLNGTLKWSSRKGLAFELKFPRPEDN